MELRVGGSDSGMNVGSPQARVRANFAAARLPDCLMQRHRRARYIRWGCSAIGQAKVEISGYADGNCVANRP